MRVYLKIKDFLIKFYTMLSGLGHPIEKAVLFGSFDGRQYSDNPRAVSQKMHEMFPDFKIIWVINESSMLEQKIPSYVEVIDHSPLEYYKRLATVFAFVTNEAIPSCYYKRKGQYFVQTWHGDRGYKKILFECDENANTIDSKVTDLCVAGSTFGIKLFENAFGFKGKILSVGCPRNDALVSDIIDKNVIAGNLHLGSQKVLLYAPTFRDSKAEYNTYAVDLSQILNILERNGDEWIGFVRLHPAYNNINVTLNDKRIINVTDYPDMSDLLQITDMLITDYSSSACDFVITRKPILIAAFDKDEYIASSRNFKIDIEDPGFIVTYSQEELENKISALTDKDYADSCEKVIKYFGINETGKASEKVCKCIYKNYVSLHGEK